MSIKSRSRRQRPYLKMLLICLHRVKSMMKTFLIMIKTMIYTVILLMLFNNPRLKRNLRLLQRLLLKQRLKLMLKQMRLLMKELMQELKRKLIQRKDLRKSQRATPATTGEIGVKRQRRIQLDLKPLRMHTITQYMITWSPDF